MNDQSNPNVSPLLNTEQAAQILGVNPGTITNWRTHNIGPAYIKLGKGRFAHVRYRQSAIDAYLASGEIEPGAA